MDNRPELDVETDYYTSAFDILSYYGNGKITLRDVISYYNNVLAVGHIREFIYIMMHLEGSH